MVEHLESESLDERYARLREKCEREDLVMFINACFAATHQNEYYTDRYERSVSVSFLHRYVMANYRRLYARAIAAGINHFNLSLILANLLEAGAPADPEHRAEEGELIAAALRQLPANRAYGLLKTLQKRRINNRRTRAVVKRFLQWRQDPAFDAIKYRNKYRSAAAHAHVRLDDEFGTFLFRLKKPRQYKTPLFDKYRQAHYSASAIYDLPFTVAESLAVRHRVPRDVFLKKIEPKMTAAEKLRYQTTAARTKGARLDFDLSRAPLTRLALYVLSLPTAERIERSNELHAALQQAASRTRSKSPLSLGRVAAVLDRSRSASGSREKRNRPLAVALAVSYLLRAAAAEYRACWTPTITDGDPEFTVNPAGQTGLAEPMIDALEWQPDLIVIVSDGYENDPPQAVSQIAQVYCHKLAGDKGPEMIHVNPVFDSDHYSPRPLGSPIATVGLRDAEDLATMLGFARFANGTAPLSDLEEYLAFRMRLLLESDER